MQRGLAVVEPPFRQNADQVIGVEINRIRIRRGHIVAAAEPADDLPWRRTEKVFPARRTERCAQAVVVDHCGRQDLPRIRRANDVEFALPVHRDLPPAACPC